MTNQLLMFGRKAKNEEQVKQQEFGRLVELYRDKAFAVAFKMTLGNRADAEELVQDAFVRAYRFWDKYDPEKPFDSWLLRIMRNIQIDKKRKQSAISIVSEEDSNYNKTGERYNYSDEDQTGVDEQVINNCESEKVMEIVNTLPEVFRTVVLLADSEGMSYEDIAEVTATNVGTVRSRIHRGRKLLKEKLTEAGIIG